MFKLFSKIIFILAVSLGLLYAASGFSFAAKAVRAENNTDKSNDTKMQTGFDVRNLSHHLLDFYK